LPPSGTKPPQECSGADLELRRASHRAIAAVTEDLNALRFNRAVAQIYTLANALGAAGAVDNAVRREALETLVLLIGPMMPHLAETCWEALGQSMLVAMARWPSADPRLVKSETITIAVQVNGKRRGEIEIPREAEEEAVRSTALALDSVQRALEGRPPRRVIVVPGRIVNVVA
jgi:leucyl-tRNA synthetase